MAKDFSFDEEETPPVRKPTSPARRKVEPPIVDDDDEDDEDDRPVRRKARSAGPSTVGDFLSFRRMMVPVLIQLFFWFGVVVCLAAGVYGVTQKQQENQLAGVAMMLFGPFLWRIYCEMLIVVFRINETLTGIKNLLEKQSRR